MRIPAVLCGQSGDIVNQSGDRERRLEMAVAGFILMELSANCGRNQASGSGCLTSRHCKAAAIRARSRWRAYSS
jgi:hypothetical protein